MPLRLHRVALGWTAPSRRGQYAGGTPASTFVALLVALFATSSIAELPEPVYPGAEWATTNAAALGFDTNKLQKFEERVRGSGCIIRRGYLVHAWGRNDLRADYSSATKTIYAHLVYKAVEQGKIPSLESYVVEWEPELKKLNSELGSKDAYITWRDLVTQTSCYGTREKPGTAFNYSDYQTALLIDTLVYRVFETEFGAADDLLMSALLCDPIGCQDAPTFSAGSSRSHVGRIRISSRDFARFVLLYVRGGKWGDLQIAPAELVTEALSTPLPQGFPRTTHERVEMLPNQRSIGWKDNLEAHMNSYSYFWWLNGVMDDGERVLPSVPPDAFAAVGHSGEHIAMGIPSLDVVVCWQDGLRGRQPWRYSSDGHKKVDRMLKLLMDSVIE